MANPFTPEQIAQILEAFFDAVGTRQYIGARYVPIFGRKDETSIIWDNSAPYEPLTIVLYQGNSFTSRQYVPTGVEITNQEFWANTGNYNAQVEEYRRIAQASLDEARAAQNDINTLLPKDDFSETNTVKAYIDSQTDSVKDVLPFTDFDSTNTVKAYIDVQVGSVEDVLPLSEFDTVNTVKSGIDAAQLTADNSKRANRYMVAIGDSFGDPNAGGIAPLPVKWPVRIANGLGIGLVNACKSGCGFTYSEGTPWTGQPDNKFINQINYAAGVVDPDLVDYVVIYGGVNDYTRRALLGDTMTEQINAMISAVVECVRNAHNKFPHSTIYLCYSDVGFCHQSRFDNFWVFWGGVNNILQQLSVNERATSYNNDACTWLIPYGSVAFQSDQLHPSEMGQNIIANHIMSIVSGGKYVNGLPRTGTEVTVTGDNDTSMVIRMTQLFDGFTSVCSFKRVSGSLTFANAGNHDIYGALQFFKFGTSQPDAYVQIASGTNWQVFWLPYAAVLRVITSAANVTVPDFAGFGTALLT